MPDTRFSWAVILDLLDVLEHAGYRRSDDDAHTGRAIALLWDAARVYAAELDEPEAVPVVRLVARQLAQAEADRNAARPSPDPAAQLEEIRAVFEAFDWATDDRQYALEEIDTIVRGEGR